jgi:NAD-dependent SIR2 family protein deacetylase
MDIYWNIFMMHGSMNVKFPNNTSKWQMEFNSAFKELKRAAPPRTKKCDMPGLKDGTALE